MADNGAAGVTGPAGQRHRVGMSAVKHRVTLTGGVCLLVSREEGRRDWREGRGG